MWDNVVMDHRKITLMLAGLAVRGTARASEPETAVRASPPAGETARADETARVAADASLGAFDEDGMATLHASLAAGGDGEAWKMFVDPRFRLRTLDRAPVEGTLRREDWDEPSDFAHVLRELTFRAGQAEATTFRLTLGEMDEVSIGHGTIVRYYTNAIDPDHLRGGAIMRIDDPWFGFEALVDSYVGPRLVAARASAHPLDERVTIGGTAAFDLYAPDAVRMTADGARSVDGARNLETYFSTLAMAGGDADVRIEDGAVAVTPYADGNALLGLGAGLHTGALVEVAPDAARFALRGEYRFGSDGYLPAYAGTLYDLTRLQHALAAPGADPAPQRAAADDGGFGGHGFAADVSLELRRFRAGAGFSRRPGAEGNLLALRIDVPAGSRAALVGRYLHRAIGQAGAAGAIVAAGLRVMLGRSFYATADYAHLPRLDEDGVYRPIHVATAGLGATIGF